MTESPVEENRDMENKILTPERQSVSVWVVNWHPAESKLLYNGRACTTTSPQCRSGSGQDKTGDVWCLLSNLFRCNVLTLVILCWNRGSSKTNTTRLRHLGEENFECKRNLKTFHYFTQLKIFKKNFLK